MTAASFYTLFYWAVFGAVVVWLMVFAERARQDRLRQREIRERRARRDYMNSREPKPWVRP